MFPNLPSSRFKPRRYRPGRIGNWSGHLPLAADLIDALRPSLLVELGTHYGESYFGFCQAIREQGLSCQSFAVDTWVGDSQTGRYGDHVFHDVSAHNAAHYQSFSTLLRMSFDEAIEYFRDETIDLLHLDGCHTYEAIQHDFGLWLSKVRAGGIILIHDVAVREGDFGAWRFWEEICGSYPSFAFHHDCGLGIILKGDAAAVDIPLLAEMLGCDVDGQRIRDYYVLCAERLQYAHEVAGEYASFCQAFSPDTTGYSTERSATYPVSAGAEASVEFSLASPAGPLRLDPCDCAGVIEISDIVVDSPAQGAILWRLDPSQFHKIQIAGTCIRIPDERRLILCSYGDDPQLYLPSFESPDPAEPVRVRCRFRIDRGWQAAESLWREMGACLSHVREKMEAHHQQTERLEAELAQTASQATHYKTLLDEQQHQRMDAQNRLAEAASQAAHYKNLLDEQQRQRADAETRLQDATSLAAHNQNLLDEERRRAEVAERALCERNSELADAHSKLADAENCARESAAKANCLEGQVRMLGEALEDVKQQLAQERSVRMTAEEEVSSMRDKLARFPARLFVR